MADAYDLLTLAEAKTAVKQSATTTYDVLLTAWNTAVARRLDLAVGPIVQRTVTAELQDGGSHSVQTRYYPVSSFMTVKEYISTTATTLTRETNASKPNDAYMAMPYRVDPTFFSGILRRRTNGTPIPFCWAALNVEQAVELTYVAGRYASTSVVDELFKSAARLMLQNIWNSARPDLGQSGEFDAPQHNWPRFAIPNAVRTMLADHWQDGPRIGASGPMVR